MIRPEQDAYGQEVYDFFHGQDVTEIIEREDGYIEVSGGPPAYFALYGEWPSIEQEAIQLAHGRCLDIGCGPGRVCLYLQERGQGVVGIDNSPLAVKVARLRGVEEARVMSITQISRNKLGAFDSIILFGNNFGLFGSAKRAQWLLRRFHKMTPAGGRILAVSLDIYQTDNPDHLAYQQRNRERGRMAGQIRLRVLYKKLKGPWFDYLMVSPQEMADLVASTGWHIARILNEPNEAVYSAVLEKSS